MAPDDLDRDKMYTAGADDWDSDAELELEPPDPQVLAAEQRRAAEAIDVHRKTIDIDEVYRDVDANRDNEIVAEWVNHFRNFRFQFQIRHLLILTAVVAMLLAVSQWINLGTVFIVGIMLAVAGVSLYLKLEENKRQEAADRRRRKMYAERRAQQGIQTGQRVDADDLDEDPGPPMLRDETPPPTAPVRSFRFQFSLSQMLVVITVAAVRAGSRRRDGRHGGAGDDLRTGRAGRVDCPSARIQPAGSRRLWLVDGAGAVRRAQLAGGDLGEFLRRLIGRRTRGWSGVSSPVIGRDTPCSPLRVISRPPNSSAACPRCSLHRVSRGSWWRSSCGLQPTSVASSPPPRSRPSEASKATAG